MESNKVAVITGGGRGLGEATVIDLLLQGFKVVCADHNELHIDQVANKINKEHFSSFLPCKTDVSNRNDVKYMYSKALERFGTVDILINFAGINRDKPFIELDDEDWDNVMDVHLKGAFICCQ